MNIDIEWLKKLSRGASRGPWTRSKAGHVFAGNDRVAECPPCQGHRGERNAKFIAAANPSTVLTLVERIEEAEAERDALAAYANRVKAARQGFMVRTLERGLSEAIDAAPATSLARQKLLWQVEALEDYAKRLARDNEDSTEQVCIEDVHDALLSEANRLRRQAEEIK